MALWGYFVAGDLLILCTEVSAKATSLKKDVHGPDGLKISVANADKPGGVRVPFLKLLILIAVIFAVSLPSPARADHLFDPGSGFHKARFERSTIRVCDATGRVDILGVIGPWNRAAGWQLFAPSCDIPDVVFQEGTSTLVQTTYLEPFTGCVVQFASSRVQTLQHELAHCLGFADHVYAAEYGPLWVNPAVCDDSSHPAYVAYRGVASYCESTTARTWFGTDDQQMLSRAGYAIQSGEDASNEVRVAGMKPVAGAETEDGAARGDSTVDSVVESPSSNTSGRQREEAASRSTGLVSAEGNATSNKTPADANPRLGATATSLYAPAPVLAVLALLISGTVVAIRRRLIL